MRQSPPTDQACPMSAGCFLTGTAWKTSRSKPSASAASARAVWWDSFSPPRITPLLLQFNEACPSVLAPFAGKSLYKHQGQRVVTGQRLMQSASDIFLGWTQGRRQLYVRQLRDMKMSAPVEAAAEQLTLYAGLCGRTLAHAHAKSGDAAMITGYLGKSDAFDQAIGEFALAYADQNEKDYTALVAAVKAGRIKATAEEEEESA
jgi:Uncharacterized protein conserved in bacteria (DUF2252)